MNRLAGKIVKIQHSGAILLVDIDVEGQGFSALLIESSLPPTWLQPESEVDLVFKETEVTLAKNRTGIISMRNRMICIVQKIDRGELLSKVTLQFLSHTLLSAITTRSIESLQLQVGDEVEALVKANEVSLMMRK